MRPYAGLVDSLDQLVAAFLAAHPGRLPSKTTVMELMTWAAKMAASPELGKR